MDKTCSKNAFDLESLWFFNWKNKFSYIISHYRALLFSWIFIGKTDAEAEALILWPCDVKDLHARKDWRQKEREAEDETDSITDSMDMNLSELLEMVEDKETWRATVQGVTKNQTWQWLNNKNHCSKYMLAAINLYLLLCNVGDLGLTAGLGRSSGEGNDYPL